MVIIDEYFLGQYRGDKKHGKGTYYFANGNQYTGDWVDDQRTGRGIFIWTNGNRYEMKHSQVFYPHCWR
jgi:hypothetical protein